MKRILYFILLISAVATGISSCDNSETYADKRDKEDAAIAQFISDNNISVISEEQFSSQGETTDTAKNQYVLFETSGVYMQIVNKGYGTVIPSSGDDNHAIILTRFWEYNLLTSDTLTNNTLVYSGYPEHMYVVNSSGTFTGMFTTDTYQPSLMYSAYSSTAVPSGWLIPLRYVNIGRPSPVDGEVAQVKLIVPAAQGQSYASANVQPCYYELSFEKQR